MNALFSLVAFGLLFIVKSGTLFLLYSSSVVLVLSNKRSFEYAWNSYCPIFFAVRTVSVTAGSAISYLSNTSKSRHFSSEGFPTGPSPAWNTTGAKKFL